MGAFAGVCIGLCVLGALIVVEQCVGGGNSGVGG